MGADRWLSPPPEQQQQQDEFARVRGVPVDILLVDMIAKGMVDAKIDEMRGMSPQGKKTFNETNPCLSGENTLIPDPPFLY